MTGMTIRERAYRELGYSQALLSMNRFLQSLPKTLTTQEALEAIIAWVKIDATRQEAVEVAVMAEVRAEQEAMLI